jgi:hypothetical protein
MRRRGDGSMKAVAPVAAAAPAPRASAHPPPAQDSYAIHEAVFPDRDLPALWFMVFDGAP